MNSSIHNLASRPNINSARTGTALIAAALCANSPNTLIRRIHYNQNVNWMIMRDYPQRAYQFYARPGFWSVAVPEKPATATAEAELETIFNGLVEKWRKETGGCSLTTRRYAHSSYQSILTLRQDVIPLILRELQQRPDWWFEALKALTKQDPTEPADNFHDAVKAWVKWGKDQKLIS